MLAETLDVVRPLDVVYQPLDCVAEGEEVPETVELDAPGVAAALREQLELLRPRVVAPGALLELDAPDTGRGRAPLAAVQPAVGTPGQRVGERMRVFHPEAL